MAVDGESGFLIIAATASEFPAVLDRVAAHVLNEYRPAVEVFAEPGELQVIQA